MAKSRKRHHKRAAGQGTIRQRKTTDKRWEGRFPNGYNEETGAPKFIYVYGDTQECVVQKLQKLLSDKMAGIHIGKKYGFTEFSDKRLRFYGSFRSNYSMLLVPRVYYACDETDSSAKKPQTLLLGNSPHLLS